jgi:hypothetical protein
MRKKNNKSPRVRWVRMGLFDKIAIALGWIALSPFILSELLIMGFKWVIEKIKRK